MKLIFVCSSCKTRNPFTVKSSDRGALQMKIGKNEVLVDCKRCGTKEKKHLNEIRAIVDNKIILIGLGIGLLSTVVLWALFGAIGTISLTLPILFWMGESSSVNTFNKFLVKRS